MTRARDLAKGTFSGDLTVDTNTLVVDSANNSVGIGISSPGARLDVEGAAASNNLAIKINNTDTSGYSTLQMGGTDAGIYRNGSAQSSYGGNSSLNVITVGAHPISFSTSNTPRVTIDSAGRVTMPYQPSFAVSLDTSIASTGAYQIIPFNNATAIGKYNIGGHLNTSTGVFTAPVSGAYAFSAGLIWSSVGSGQDMSDAFLIYLNGTLAGYSARRARYVANSTGSGGYYTDSYSNQQYLNANDTLAIINTRGGLSILGNIHFSYFSGHLIG